MVRGSDGQMVETKMLDDTFYRGEKDFRYSNFEHMERIECNGICVDVAVT